MSDVADLVIGVEICEPAVEDAKRNAELNKVDNTLFVCRAAEKELKSLLQNEKRIRQVARSVMPKLFEKDENRPIRVIAVVDPPRNGLHSRALRALRKCTLIDDLIYVSCNPSGTLIDNAIDLCRPELLKQKDRDYIKGPHFNLTHAYPVDMFPHTTHCEMVMAFERGGEEVKDDATAAFGGDEMIYKIVNIIIVEHYSSSLANGFSISSIPSAGLTTMTTAHDSETQPCLPLGLNRSSGSCKYSTVSSSTKLTN